MKKNRETKEQRVRFQNQRQPNVLAKGEGLELAYSEPERADILQALSLESSTVRSHEVTLKHIESERTPTASRPQNLPSNLKRLRTGVPLIQASSRLSSLEEKVFVMSDKFDSLF